MRRRPLLAVTMGDPAGCGPEIVAKVAASNAVRDVARIFCVGDVAVMGRAFQIIGEAPRVHRLARLEDVQDEPGSLDVLDLANVDLDRLQMARCRPAPARRPTNMWPRPSRWP